jgi:hypothetical protein
VPLYPRIQNVGMNVKSISQVRKEYDNVGIGDGDERISMDQLVTIRGVLPPPLGGEWGCFCVFIVRNEIGCSGVLMR